MEKLFNQSGFAIWFLFALSIFSLYFYLEKLWLIIKFHDKTFSDIGKIDPGSSDRLIEIGSAADLQIEKFKVALSKLGSIATLSPYIGLLGTVIGIMDAFSAIAKSGVSSFVYVSRGISEALVATAAGLLLAILSTFCYNHLIARLRIIQCEKDAAIKKSVRSAQKER